METGNEAKVLRLGTRLGYGDWERGYGVETGNEAKVWRLGTRLRCGGWERG